MQCYGDFKQIALALQNYEATYGSLPPAYLTDSKGRPTLSWRVLILPFMGQDSLYRSFNLSEPWDSPTNIKLLGEMPGVLGCPNRSWDIKSGRTKCVAITGPGTMFPGATSAKFADVADGLDETIMLAEVENLSVPWTAPVDLNIRTMSLRPNDPKTPGISSPHSSPHSSGPAVCSGAGQVAFVPRWISPEEMKALMTIAGHESPYAWSSLRW
ncbi:MAG: hypothetical protein JWN86_3990 [Planctomycetota bacterium]|nr:hypothetical protein [Planctomycetota bacterium]